MSTFPKLPEKLEPFRGIILFAVVLMVSNFIWKYNVLGDEEANIHSTITLWGIDITAPFSSMAIHVATLSRTILNALGWDINLTAENALGYTNGNYVRVIWACTGLKQAYITLCILLFARGKWIHKLWFIPLTLAVVYCFNVFRIAFIAASIENHPEWFEFLHLYAFKYAFYGVIFLMWLLWEEKIVGTKGLKKDVDSSEQ